MNHMDLCQAGMRIGQRAVDGQGLFQMRSRFWESLPRATVNHAQEYVAPTECRVRKSVIGILLDRSLAVFDSGRYPFGREFVVVVHCLAIEAVRLRILRMALGEALLFVGRHSQTQPGSQIAREIVLQVKYLLTSAR